MGNQKMFFYKIIISSTDEMIDCFNDPTYFPKWSQYYAGEIFSPPSLFTLIIKMGGGGSL